MVWVNKNKRIREKRTFRRWISVIGAALYIIGAAAAPVQAAVDPNASFQVDSNAWQHWPQAVDVQAKTGIVMEAETGAILYAKGMDAQRYPASLTKIMTSLMLLENCTMDEKITMTETGLAEAYPGSSNSNPTLGEVFTAEQCLQMMMIKSANDIATQVAEHIGGSVQGYADLANARARELGCTNTNFCNASGLDNNPNHYTSAHDLALITREALKYDKFRETFGTRYVTIPATNTSDARGYGTHIMMLDPATQYYYEGCIGGKTGFTDEAQNCLMVCAERNGVTLIGILLDCTDGALICQDMAKILDYGFGNFKKTDVTDGLKVSEGGTAMLPSGITESDLTVRETKTESGQIELSYLYQDRLLGTALVSEQDYTLWKQAQAAPTASVTRTPISASDTHSQGHSSQITASSKIVYIVMAVLAILILTGIILIFVGAHRNKRHRKK